MADANAPEPSCASCGVVQAKLGTTSCYAGTGAGAPPRPGHCPTSTQEEIVRGALDDLRGDGPDAKLARVAARVEGLGYDRGPDGVRARWTRVEDTIAFAKLMGYRRIGIATCIGLLDESERLAAILAAQGLEPMSVCCKAGSIDKLALGLSEKEKVRPGTFEPACNPIAQAKILNRAKADMNVIVGLCVGHDMLFAKYSKAPVTTLVVKDRVTNHNPAAVLYGQNFYYKRLQKQPVVVPEAAKGKPPAKKRA